MKSKKLVLLILLASVSLSGCGVKYLFQDQPATVELVTISGKKVESGGCPQGEQCILFTRGGAKAGHFGGLTDTNSLVIGNAPGQKPDVLNLGSGNGGSASSAVLPVLVNGLTDIAATATGAGIMVNGMRSVAKIGAKAMSEASANSGPGTVIFNDGSSSAYAGNRNDIYIKAKIKTFGE